MVSRVRSLHVEDEETVSVRNWLEGVQVEDGELESTTTVESLSQLCDKSAPFTPVRQTQLEQPYTELSPTDTTFSYNSVFDPPEDTPPHPTRPLVEDYENSYAETDASSVCGDVEKRCDYPTAPGPRKVVLLPTPPNSIHSDDPPTEDENAPDADAANPTTELDRDSTDTPRIHHLVSCLQCVFTGLSCTRRTPACSRCQRKDQGDMCLLQRRRMRSELIDGCGNFNRMPVLLKVWGCDEAVHKRKVELAEELIQAWLSREERKNWILPENDGRLGDWKTTSRRVPMVHPGDGLGQTHYETLRVVHESPVL